MVTKTSQFALVILVVLGVLVGAAGQSFAEEHSFDLTKYQEANIDWKQFEGERLLVAMNQHWFTDAMEVLIPEFEALTGIRVTLDVYPEQEFRKKRVIAMASESGIFDVMMMDQALSQYAGAGWLEPLTPYFENPELTDAAWYDLDDVFAKARRFGAYKDVFYGMPITGEAQILFYRKDLFEEAGINVPETMDELYDAAVKLKTADRAGIVNRGQRGAGANLWPWTGFLFTYGGRYFDADENPIFNSAEAVAATEMYIKLLKDGGPEGVASYNWYECSNDFSQGKAAMFIDSSGFMPNFEDPEQSTVADKVGYAMMPKVPGKELLPNFWYWMIALASSSEHKEEGFLFIQWLTSKTASLPIALTGGSSARASIWAHPDFVARYPADWAETTSNTLAVADPSLVPYYKKEFFEFGELISIAIADAITGTQAVQAGLDKSLEGTKKILGIE